MFGIKKRKKKAGRKLFRASDGKFYTVMEDGSWQRVFRIPALTPEGPVKDKSGKPVFLDVQNKRAMKRRVPGWRKLSRNEKVTAMTILTAHGIAQLQSKA